MESDSALKENEILPLGPQGHLLSEISQAEKDQYHVISLICGIFKKKKKAHSYREQSGGRQRQG